MSIDEVSAPAQPCGAFGVEGAFGRLAGGPGVGALALKVGAVGVAFGEEEYVPVAAVGAALAPESEGLREQEKVSAPLK